MQVDLEVETLLSKCSWLGRLQQHCSTVPSKKPGMEVSLALWAFENVQRHMHLICARMLMGRHASYPENRV